MTFGWALALVGIVVAMFFVLGVFDISNFLGSKAIGFSEVAVKDWRMDAAGTFSIMVTSHATQKINVSNVSITIGNQTKWVNRTVGQLAIGTDSGILTTAAGAFGPQQTGAGYTAKVDINFTNIESGFVQTSGGTLVGKVI